MATSTGTVVAVIGPVVDVKFSEGDLPDIYTSLELKNPSTDEKLVCEVAQHLGDGVVRSVAMSSTEGLRRGVDVLNTGEPIAVPVGSNVLGDPRTALTWLVNELSSLNITLHSGEFVTTGTCTVPLLVKKGDHIIADYGELGKLEINNDNDLVYFSKF